VSKKDLFIVLTPLHVYVAKLLIKHLDISCYKIITTWKYIEFFNEEHVVEISIGELQDGKMKKLYLLWLLSFRATKGSYNRIFIPSDVNPYVQVILKANNFKELNFFEEGGTLFYRINELINGKPTSGNVFLKKLLGLTGVNNILQDKRIVNAYTFFPSILSELNPNINFIGIDSFFNNYNLDIEYPVIDVKYLNSDILIFTQPLTEDKFCKSNEEVLIIEKFIKCNSDKKIIIKLHPRDIMSNYRYLLKYNVIFLPEDYRNIPYQVMHASIRPKNIVSFFSSILFSVPSLTNNFQRVSLINSIGNTNIKKVVHQMGKYFGDLKILDTESSKL
jgi:hypothetical protein